MAVKTKEKKVEVPKLSRDRILELIGEMDTKLAMVPKYSKRDLKMFASLTDMEVRDAVDDYYAAQNGRIRVEGKLRAYQKEVDDEGIYSLYLNMQLQNQMVMESLAKDVLTIFVQNHKAAAWFDKVKGLGPIISANLIANIDIHKAKSAGQIISYFGLADHKRPWLGSKVVTERVNSVLGNKKNKDITYEDFCMCCNLTKWKPENAIEATDFDGNYIFKKENMNTGEIEYTFTKDKIIRTLSKRPYNAKMKKTMWLLGESFIKVQNKPDAFYGKLFAERKAEETARSEAGEYREQALKRAQEVGKETEAYKYYIEGKLPPAHIIARAKRWVNTIFLNHLHEVLCRVNDLPVSEPYIIAQGGHVHKIDCPYLDVL